MLHKTTYLSYVKVKGQNLGADEFDNMFSWDITLVPEFFYQRFKTNRIPNFV